MIKKPITINLSTGLEARPVAQLVQVASQFNSEIYVHRMGDSVNEEYKGIQTERKTDSRCIPFRFKALINMKEEDYLCQKY